MNQPFSLTADQFLILCGIMILGLVAAWAVAFHSMRGQSKLSAALFADGLFLRLLTVVFVVCAVFGLALVGRLTSEIATIFSGIVGYVLGSAKSEKTRDGGDTSPSASDQRSAGP